MILMTRNGFFFLDAEPILKICDMLAEPLEQKHCAAVQDGQEDSKDMLASEDKSCEQIDVPHNDGEPCDVISVFINQEIFFCISVTPSSHL